MVTSHTANLWRALTLLLPLGWASACTDSRPAAESAAAQRSDAVAWAPPIAMLDARCQAAAAPLGDGKVLVCGGLRAPGEPEASCGIYDARAGLTGGPALASPRYSFTLTATEPGSAIAIGGLREGTGTAAFVGSVEHYTWAAQGPSSFRANSESLDQPRHGHATVVLDEGQVLVTGGIVPGDTSALTDEILIGGQWQAAGSSQRSRHTATLLPGNRVMVVGGIRRVGTASTVLDTWSIYTEDQNSWSLEASTGSDPRAFHTATTLSNGDVLVVGGVANAGISQYLRSVIRYSVEQGTWSDEPPLEVARAFHAAALIDGKVVVTGGRNPTPLDSVEVYDPLQRRWSTLAPMGSARERHALTPLDQRRLLASGGCGPNSRSLGDAEVFAPALKGEACVERNNECLSGHCVEQVCCATECGEGYACPNGDCATTCATDSQCRSGFFCDGSACVEKKPLGLACSSDPECASGHCVDGYCCERECGQCEACDGGEKGRCELIGGPPRASRQPCDGIGAGTGCGKVCNEVSGRCEYPPAGDTCDDRSCEDAIEEESSCDGQGRCTAVPRECGAFACDADAQTCRTECESNEHCAVGHVCRQGVCAVIADLGEPCAANRECSTELCVDGVCCAEQCGEGLSCNLEPAGFCKKDLGARCVRGSECASGHCVDGVCCSSACEGQCEACDVAKNEGTCVAVRGAPHAPRELCDEADGWCGARECDGHTRTSCEGFVRGTDVSCGDAHCQGDAFVPAAACDGRGSCQSPLAVPCAFGLSCVDSAASTGCLERCAADADCADGYVCRDGECLAGGYCEDELTFRAENGQSASCGKYRCAPDGCRTTCQTLSDCHPDFVCDDALGQCVAVPPVVSSDVGGCSCSVPRGSGRGGVIGWSALIVALAVVRRARIRRVHQR